jgi:hypothetical protein
MHRSGRFRNPHLGLLTPMGEAAAAFLQVAAFSPDDSGMQTYEAAVTLPMAHVMAATSRLRGDLRHRILDEGGLVLPDWPTLRVFPPVERFDDDGRVVYEYRATVEVHDLSGLLDPNAVV